MKRTHRWVLVSMLIAVLVGMGFATTPTNVDATVDSIVITESSCDSVTFTAYFTRESDTTYPVQDSLFDVHTNTIPLYNDGIYHVVPTGPNPSLTHSVTFPEQPEGTTIYISVDHGYGFTQFDLMTTSYDCTAGVAAEPVPGCDATINIPSSAVGASLIADTTVYWAPGKASNEVFPSGLHVRAIGVDESGMYTQVLFVCGFYWVPTDTIGPNYDAPWYGAALPTDIVE